MIDDQFDGLERIDFARIAAHAFMASRMAARSTTAGTPVKSWSSTRAGMKAISRVGSALGVPLGQGGDVLGPHRLAILAPQQVFQQHLHRKRQTLGLGILLVHRGKAEDRVILVVDFERTLAGERIGHRSSPRAKLMATSRQNNSRELDGEQP